MPPDSIQRILTAFEISLFLIGLWLLCRLAFNAAFRTRWGGTNRLAPWPVAAAEFAIYLLVMVAGGFILQSVARFWLGGYIQQATDRSGLEILVYGMALDGGALFGWLMFPALRRSWHADYGGLPAETSPPEPGTSIGWLRSFLYGGSLVALAMPLLLGLSVGWTFLLRKMGLPDDPQDAIAIFANTKSRLVVAGMLVVACVLAPMMEELLFRAGVYRFCRQRLGRGPALVISGVLFGAIHANWAGFLPLAFLGVVLALAYEATGSIRVAVIAHAFFNLNSILIILSGMSP